MKIAVTGTPNFNDYQVMSWYLNDRNITELITCESSDVDALAKRYAEEKGIPIKTLHLKKRLPGWFYFMKKCYVMVHKCDVLLAFSNVKSTKVSCLVKIAHKMGKETIVVKSYPQGKYRPD